jgi:hypothetical protein
MTPGHSIIAKIEFECFGMVCLINFPVEGNPWLENPVRFTFTPARIPGNTIDKYLFPMEKTTTTE